MGVDEEGMGEREGLEGEAWEGVVVIFGSGGRSRKGKVRRGGRLRTKGGGDGE